jgi:hypothetical protein
VHEAQGQASRQASDEARQEGILIMGAPRLDYSFAGLREERELAAAPKQDVAVWRKIKPEHGIGMVGDVKPLPAKPAGKPKKGY